jgi:molybdopterin-guanine dinucleotide biosynthesis protein A
VKAPFSALVLAGGQSSRMGRPKATLELSGVALWRRQVATLQGLGPSEILISAGADWSPGEGSWKVITDRVAGLGPLAGLQSAFAAMSTEWLLVLGVDMPAMSLGMLGRILAQSGEKGVVPVLDGFYQGLAALYPRSVAALVDAALATEFRSLQSLIGGAVNDGLVEARPVTDADRSLFWNVNRPGDL